MRMVGGVCSWGQHFLFTSVYVRIFQRAIGLVVAKAFTCDGFFWVGT